MTLNFEVTYLVAAILLAVAVIQDLRTRKVRNSFVLIALAIGILTQIALLGVGGIQLALAGFAAGLAVSLPLTLLKVIGAGDMKIFVAVSTLLDWKASIVAFGLSLIWSSLLGVLQVLLKGEIKQLATNMIFVLNKTTRPTVQTHKLPYTVGLLLGLLSQWVLSSRGVELL